MVKNNGIPIEVKKPVETVCELKDEYKIPSLEEFMKDYKTDENIIDSYNCELESYGDIGTQESYGPGDRWKRKRDNDHLINTLNNVSTFDKRDWWDKDMSAHDGGDWKLHNIATSSGSRVGFGGLIASGSASYSAFRVGDEHSDASFGGVSVGGEVGLGVGGITAGYSASLDAVNARVGAVRAKVGLDGGSSVTVGADRFETKVAGFGFSVGKKTGISTPIGEIAVDSDDCVVQ